MYFNTRIKLCIETFVFFPQIWKNYHCSEITKLIFFACGVMTLFFFLFIWTELPGVIFGVISRQEVEPKNSDFRAYPSCFIQLSVTMKQNSSVAPILVGQSLHSFFVFSYSGAAATSSDLIFRKMRNEKYLFLLTLRTQFFWSNQMRSCPNAKNSREMIIPLTPNKTYFVTLDKKTTCYVYFNFIQNICKSMDNPTELLQTRTQHLRNKQLAAINRKAGKVELFILLYIINPLV